MQKILSIFGTRPEAIKMAPVIKELVNNPTQFKSVVCVTAQHREMLDQVLNLFNIHPDHDLNIMKPKQNLFDVTCNVLKGLKKVLLEEHPDLVLVMRETTERPEAVEAGTVKLVGTSFEKVVRETKRLLTDSMEYKKMSQARNPYGDGRASGRIIEAIYQNTGTIK